MKITIEESNGHTTVLEYKEGTELSDLLGPETLGLLLASAYAVEFSKGTANVADSKVLRQ
jgi:hypothetical protein